MKYKYAVFVLDVEGLSTPQFKELFNKYGDFVQKIEEEVEELTEDDFMPTPEEMVDTWTLTDSGKAKLIRIINRRGKGEV